MPLRLIKRLAARILGTDSVSAKKSPAPGRGAGTQERGRDARPSRGGRPAQPGRPAAQPRPPRPDAPHAPASRPPRAASESAGTPDDRRRDGRGRRGDPRRDGDRHRRGAPQPRDTREPAFTDHGHRPGGAIESEELVRRRAAHAAWTVDRFQVAPADGKKRFHDFDLPLEIMHAVADLGFQYCTPIQAVSLDHALAGRNVAGKAQTGTGKTAAFLVAILTRYLKNPDGRPTQPGTPRALVIAPTRELVIQICKDADGLGKYCGLRYLAVYGGMDHEKQRREVQAGPVDLLVATPGRLLDYVQSRTIDLSRVDTLVIDEADRMLDMGFIPDVRRIIGRLPPREKRCTMLYSATLSDDVMRMASQWMTEPVRVEIDSDAVTVNTISQVVYVVASRDKFSLLYNLLKRHADRRVLVFCNRRDATERVAERLARYGIACDMLSGDVNQSRRLRVLEEFRSGKMRVVVATDVAGRGLHVDDIGFVINFDFPYEPEDYVHRIGRTGRAGHAGTAISFADEDESFIIPEIEKFIGEPLACVMPEDALLAPPAERGGGTSSGAQHAARAHRPAPAAAEDIAPAPHAGHAPEWPETPPSPQPVHHAAMPAAAPVAPQPPATQPSQAHQPAPASRPVANEPAPRSAAARPAVPPVILTKRPITEEWAPGGRK